MDRTHVLATPGLDTHGSYVAMSRHRDQMDLHYGKDDFADQDRLVARLNRERGKDMASDYKPADPVKAYAERRGMTFRERVAEVVKKIVPERVRGIFDGLRQAVAPTPAPDAGTAPRPGREEGASAPTRAEQARGQQVPAQAARSPAEEPEAALRRERTVALKRHAQAFDIVQAFKEGGGHASPDQMHDLTEARKAFEDVRPHGWQDAEAAYTKPPPACC